MNFRLGEELRPKTLSTLLAFRDVGNADIHEAAADNLAIFRRC
jgi:hypothetical protein